MPPTVAIIAAGAMGAALGARLVSVGRCTVYTALAGRSPGTIERARKAGLVDIPLSDVSSRAEWVLSVLPPSEAHGFAKSFLDAHSEASPAGTGSPTRVFVDCNAISPITAKNISSLFTGSGIAFIDAGIIGGPPSGDYDPTIYASADAADAEHLDSFEMFNDFGLKVVALRGEDGVEGGGVGDASALKMSYAGISKGLVGLFSTMILSAYASSPRTASALLNELSISQPVLLKRIGMSVPNMIPKAYRWVGEMEEIGDFVDSGLVPEGSTSPSSQVKEEGMKEVNGAKDREDGAGRPGDVYRGLAALYARIERELKQNGREAGDVRTLIDFAEEARRVSDSKSVSK